MRFKGVRSQSHLQACRHSYRYAAAPWLAGQPSLAGRAGNLSFSGASTAHAMAFAIQAALDCPRPAATRPIAAARAFDTLVETIIINAPCSGAIDADVYIGARWRICITAITAITGNCSILIRTTTGMERVHSRRGMAAFRADDDVFM